MNKSEVCVKLTRKNCKKVLGILEMFGEKVYFTTKEWLGVKDIEYPYIDFDRGSWSGSYGLELKTLIKPRELRNILAKEHLKKGDIVAYKISMPWVAVVERVEGDRLIVSNSHCLEDGVSNDREGFEFFKNIRGLRYATDEEKALLEPKSEFGVDEFEVGEWYVSDIGHVFNYQNNGASYGLTTFDEWCDNDDILKGSEPEWRKATEAEVIESLTKECVKRYGEDWENVKIKAHASDDVHRNTSINKMYWHIVKTTYCVWNKNGNLFYKGKWAEPLKEPRQTTYTREVWVNHYSDMEFHVHPTKDKAERYCRRDDSVEPVKATLTYDIPMTKV